MDNGILNNLQLYKGKWFSDLVDENMLSNAMLTKPHEISTIVSYVFGTKDDGYSSYKIVACYEYTKQNHL